MASLLYFPTLAWARDQIDLAGGLLIYPQGGESGYYVQTFDWTDTTY